MLLACRDLTHVRFWHDAGVPLELKAVGSLSPVSVVDSLCQAIRDAMLAGHLAPGTALGEAAVAQAYAVSRLTAREALGLLVASGLLIRERNRSAVIPVLSADDRAGLLDARLAVESAALRSRHLDASAVERLQSATQRLRAIADHADERTVWRAELAFHRDLVAAAGNAWLLRAYGPIEAGMIAAQVEGSGHDSALRLAVQHGRIIRALREGDRDTAVRELCDHLVASEGRADRADAPNGDVELVPAVAAHHQPSPQAARQSMDAALRMTAGQ